MNEKSRAKGGGRKVRYWRMAQCDMPMWPCVCEVDMLSVRELLRFVSLW